MIGAMLTVHWNNGFFMNWFGAQKGEGIEFFVLALGLVAAIMVTGGGKFSVDSLFS
jgi:putative oxidoreductase